MPDPIHPRTTLLEPHDPLLIRDGRAFGPGDSARSLPFVPPTTLIGLIRTLHGSRNGSFDPRSIPELMTLTLQGPLLTELGDDDGVPRLYAPAPRDAVLLGDRSSSRLHRLKPAALEPGVLLDNDAEDLLPLVLPGEPKGKPGVLPQFWPWPAFEAWLLERKEVRLGDGVRLDQDERTHVSLDPATGTASEGLLFGTSGLEFTGRAGQRFGLSFRTNAELPTGAVPFGGERRLSVLRPGQGPTWPACPDGVLDAVARTGRARVLLLTPAAFRDGWKPARPVHDQDFTLLHDPVVQPVLRAAAVGRPLTLSGWDLKERAPKPTRRLAPEGSVYHLSLGGTPEQRRAWVQRTWWSAVSDNEQDRLDGLGLAVVGAWGDE